MDKQGGGGISLLRTILESASQAILTIDRNGTIVDANPKTSELFGYERDELIGQSVDQLLPEAVRAIHSSHRSAYFANPKPRPMGVGLDLSARRKDGSEFPVEISLSFVRVRRRPLAVAFVSDITARKQLQEQLLQAQKMEAVGRLAGGIAHDFNNLLMIITGYNRFLLDRLSPMDPLRGHAEEILRAADRAGALTRQLLAFGRRQIIQPKVLDLNSVIEESHKMHKRLIGEAYELRVHMKAGLGKIKADPTQMEQVLLNLLVNARDAMENGGRITIETANVQLDDDYAKMHLGVLPGPYVVLSVSDTGAGMDSETQRHIFEPFFTTKKDKGTGLGLATVYGIVKQNGGDIWVYSELNRGTTFKLYWPRVDAEGATESTANDEDPRKGLLPGETVLVVEDEEGVRRLICEVLRRAGYTVIEAGDSLEALQVSANFAGPVQLLLTDVIMPHSTGHHLAVELTGQRPEMKVLYISGYTENTIVHQGVIDANLHFLPKPFAFETLLAKVREAIES